MSERWVVIRNWDKFQHYKDREPLWIKVYLELANDEDWCGLSLASRGLLVSLWVEYGASRGILPLRSIGPRIRQKVLKKTLDPLVQAGFIALSASKPLALARSREVEVEVEKKKTFAHTRKQANPKPVDNSPGRSNVTPADPAAAVEAMIRNRVITDPVDLTAEIAGYRLDEATATRLRGLLQ